MDSSNSQTEHKSVSHDLANLFGGVYTIDVRASLTTFKSEMSSPFTTVHVYS